MNYVRKPNTKSLVWIYFRLEADDKAVPLSGKEDKPSVLNCTC